MSQAPAACAYVPVLTRTLLMLASRIPITYRTTLDAWSRPTDHKVKDHLAAARWALPGPSSQKTKRRLPRGTDLF